MAAKPFTKLLVELVIEFAPVLQVYVYDPVPPAVVTVADPSLAVQFALVDEVFAVNVELFPTAIVFTDIQPDPSVTVTEYVAVGNDGAV